MNVRRSGRGRAVPAVLAAVLCAAGGTAVAAPTPRAADPSPDPTPVPVTAATVALTRLTPAAPKATDKLTLTGTLRNNGTEAWAAASVRLRVSTRALTNRTEIRQVALAVPDVREAAPVKGAEDDLAPGLAPNAAAKWTLTVPVESLDLPGNGVYLVQVEARAVRQGAAVAEQVGQLSTFLPYLPKAKQYAPTKLSWLWPLVGIPDRDARGSFTGPELAQALTPGGRLADLAAAPGTTPVTWMVDPELLDAAAALAGRHTTRTGKETATEQGDPVAAAWLAALRGRLSGKLVAALPYADPDVAALTHRDLAARLAPALLQSKRTTAALLGRESDTALAWPADGLADEATLGTLRRAGATAVVLSSDAVSPTEELTYTPTGRALVPAGGRNMQVLVADRGLESALAGDLKVPGAAAAAAQLFLADTAMLTLERPNDARTVLVTPPRRWAPPAGWSAKLLAATRAVPWLELVPLPTLSRTVPAPELTGVQAVYPESAPAVELGGAFMARVRTTAESAAEVESVLAKPGGLEVGYRAGLLRAVSSHWRQDRSGGRAYLKALGQVIRSDGGKVRVIGRRTITLSSKNGTIPVTIFNELAQSVRVLPVVRPKVASRLRVTAPGMVEIRPGGKSTVRVRAEATANGITQVDVQLRSAGGRAFGPPIELKVNATNYGNLGLVVVGAAVLVLFVAAAVRNVKRIRRGGPDDPAGPNGAAHAPGRPADEKVQA